MMDGGDDEVVLSRLVHVTSGKEAGLACRICRNFCYDKYKQKFLHAMAVMVDVNETADPHLNIEKLSVGIAKLPLSDGINYISWCVRTSECLKFVKSPEERHSSYIPDGQLFMLVRNYSQDGRVASHVYEDR
jgi:hypothetical protein